LQPYRGCWICESHIGQFLWKQGRQDEYSVLLTCHICCSSYVIFETILVNARRSLSVSVDFRPLFLFADVVFPRVVYADITLETVALDTHNNVVDFIRYAPTKRPPTICPLSKSGHSLIFRFFRADCHLTQSLNTDTSTT
jgi:hypothetical protein